MQMQSAVPAAVGKGTTASGDGSAACGEAEGGGASVRVEGSFVRATEGGRRGGEAGVGV